MKKHGIWLLLTLTLSTAALSVGWNDAHAGPRQDGVSVSGANLPVVGPYHGDPDPYGTPIPRLIMNREDHQYRPSPAWSWVSGVWAMWYLRFAR
jgi:hypothetical protein